MALCNGEAKCRFWTWFSKGQLCKLFTERTDHSPAKDIISGECEPTAPSKPETNPREAEADPRTGKCLPASSGEPPFPRIMLIGETGVGKSTLGKRLLGNKCGEYASTNFPGDPSCPIQEAGHGFDACTSRTSWIAGKWLGGNETDTPCFTVIDTPGIGDTKGPAADCQNFIGVAQATREIGSIDAFLLIIKGDTTRFTPKLVEQLRFFEELFGEQFWKSIIIEVSFWSHTNDDIEKRKRRKLDENKMTGNLNQKMRQYFPDIPPIPVVFVDPVYGASWAKDMEQEIFNNQTKKLWSKTVNGKKFDCADDADGCTSPSFLTGTPKLKLADGNTTTFSQRLSGKVSVQWTIWFGDCDLSGTRSYTVFKDNEIIYKMVEDSYTGGDWEKGQGTATEEKPPTLQIVDSCSNKEPGTLKCDNLKSKYKTVTLTFDPLTEYSLGKYKIHNEKGVSEEAEVVSIKDSEPGPWGAWGPCSKTCIGSGGDDLDWGIKERRRNSSEPEHGGNPFTGKISETKACASADDSEAPSLCEGTPGEWGPWGPCSKSCGAATKARSRVCNGVICPDLKKTEKKDCPVVKCPEKGKYGKWSEWSCSSHCFNPHKRDGTSQTRTRNCTDDSPRHADLNCDTIGQPLEETVTPCTQEPMGYMTRYGVACQDGSTCATHGYNYWWCRTGAGNSEWDYCSYDKYHTINGESCYNDVCGTGGESYNWCYTDSDENWDYCSPRC